MDAQFTAASAVIVNRLTRVDKGPTIFPFVLYTIAIESLGAVILFSRFSSGQTTIKEKTSEKLDFTPKADFLFKENGVLMLLGQKRGIEKLKMI